MSEQAARRRVALVSGASSGIGEAFVHVLAARGYDVVAVARREDQLYRVKGVVEARHPGRHVHAMACDLAQPGAVGELSQLLDARGLWPMLLINNAGFGLAGAAVTLDLRAQAEMIDLNCRALTELSLACLPHMLRAGRGGIIHVASTAAFLPGPYMAVYYASKAYVLSFSEALAAECAGSGVHVSALCPGPVATGFQDRAGMHGKWLRLMMRQTAAQVAEEGFAGLQAGRRIIIPGFMNQASALAAKFLPRAVSARIAALLQKPARL
jgi:short-subunit dehydrogenase